MVSVKLDLGIIYLHPANSFFWVGGAILPRISCKAAPNCAEI